MVLVFLHVGQSHSWLLRQAAMQLGGLNGPPRAAAVHRLRRANTGTVLIATHDVAW